MAIGLLTQANYNAPYGYDFTSARRRYHGSLVFGAGNYVTGGLLPNWNPTTGVLGPTQTSAGVNAQVGGYTQPVVLNITNSALTTNVATITANNALTALQWVTFSGLTNIPSLNGQTAQVLASGLSGTQFEVDFTHANVTSAAETGHAVTVIGPDSMWIESVSGSGFIYGYNKANATVQIFTGAAAQSPLTELSAGALPSGVTGDIIEFLAEYVSQ